MVEVLKILFILTKIILLIFGIQIQLQVNE